MLPEDGNSYFHSYQFWRHCEETAFKKWVAYRKTGFSFGDNPLKTSGFLLPLPPSWCEWSHHEKVALDLSSCSGPGCFPEEAFASAERNLSLALKTGFLFKAAEGSSTWSHLILFQKKGKGI
jgi:hypothetical protein